MNDRQDLSQKDQHIYVIAFKSGRVKVGRTRDIKRRASQIASTAAAFDESIQEIWNSDVHSQAIDNETAMIAFCTRMGKQSAREYFTGVCFDDVVEFAKSLPAYINPKLREEEILRDSRIMSLVAANRAVAPFVSPFGFPKAPETPMQVAFEAAQLCQDLIFDAGGYGYIFDHDPKKPNSMSKFVLAVAVYLHGKPDEEHDAFMEKVSGALDMDDEDRKQAITDLYAIANAETMRLVSEYQLQTEAA